MKPQALRAGTFDETDTGASERIVRLSVTVVRLRAVRRLLAMVSRARVVSIEVLIEIAPAAHVYCLRRYGSTRTYLAVRNREPRL